MLRKKFLIYPKFQLILMLVNALIMMFAFGFVALQAKRSFALLETMGVNARLPPTHAYFKFLAVQSSTLYSHLIWALLVAFLVSAVITLLLSHRLAGPIIRLKSYFRNIANGENPVQRLQFRKRDFFEDLPAVINEALENIRKGKKVES